ncbi:hypothetical protein OG455_18685 [Kitasatospora sp. NBC_01287]|uniref:hypothetical protein n=1 Tax=Kitasatospora sp. NBC_01287 TaxID=2903573 RepID=UPI002251D363|nr:hypothetical protein [Kitasatospora sp. NBC_01287]MCX4747519.1 hypothetical protein [Kitasatospora sp. NBC_01287]
MWWQVIVVVVASIGFPTLALLYFIGGPNWRDGHGPRHAATGSAAGAAGAGGRGARRN